MCKARIDLFHFAVGYNSSYSTWGYGSQMMKFVGRGGLSKQLQDTLQSSQILQFALSVYITRWH